MILITSILFALTMNPAERNFAIQNLFIFIL